MKKQTSILWITAVCATVIFFAGCAGKRTTGTGLVGQNETESEQTLGATEGTTGAADHAAAEADQTSKNDGVGEEEVFVSSVPCLNELLDNSSSEKVTVEEVSYYEGEHFILYFEKDCVIPKDLPKLIEEIMTQEEAMFSLRFDESSHAEDCGLIRFYFGEDTFRGIGYRQDKLNIIICHDVQDGSIECADTNELVLFDTDFDSELDSGETSCHEIAHSLRLRQSPNLGQVLEEGIGVYAQWKMSVLRGTPCWSMIQYVDFGGGDVYDEEKVCEDAEEAFREANLAPRSAEQVHYQYGIRLISFLMDEYGENVILKISEAAAKREFQETDNDAIIEVLKEATSEDIFERFEKWLPKGWKACNDSIVEYLKKFGL